MFPLIAASCQLACRASAPRRSACDWAQCRRGLNNLFTLNVIAAGVDSYISEIAESEPPILPVRNAFRALTGVGLAAAWRSRPIYARFRQQLRPVESVGQTIPSAVGSQAAMALMAGRPAGDVGRSHQTPSILPRPLTHLISSGPPRLLLPAAFIPRLLRYTAWNAFLCVAVISAM
uniref:Uncharacterized protein n=1 Tax=Plectus sambesii TaxID=2011161 RepID=A0A914XM02_9BILA